MENKKYALYTFLTLMIETVHRISDVPACCEVTNELSFYFRCSMALRDIEGDMRNGGFIPLFCMQVLL